MPAVFVAVLSSTESLVARHHRAVVNAAGGCFLSHWSVVHTNATPPSLAQVTTSAPDGSESVANSQLATVHSRSDLTVQTKSGVKTMLVEIKPHSQTLKPERKKGKKMESFLNECYVYQVNMDKWMHAKKFAEERGWEFIVMTEEQLYGKKVKK